MKLLLSRHLIYRYHILSRMVKRLFADDWQPSVGHSVISTFSTCLPTNLWPVFRLLPLVASWPVNGHWPDEVTGLEHLVTWLWHCRGSGSCVLRTVRESMRRVPCVGTVPPDFQNHQQRFRDNGGCQFCKCSQTEFVSVYRFVLQCRAPLKTLCKR